MKSKKRIRFWILVFAVTGIIIVAVIVMLHKRDKEEIHLSVVSETDLKDVLNISELSTLEYTYNSIVAIHEEESEKVKYYVAYEGMVTVGIQFEEIRVTVDEEQKSILLTVPEAEIMDCEVNPGTLEYIFTKEKYNTETVAQEAYKAGCADLKEKAYKETELFAMARENAITSVEALVRPWIEQIDKEYTVSVQ